MFMFLPYLIFTLEVDSSVPLAHHDPRDLELICLVAIHAPCETFQELLTDPPLPPQKNKTKQNKTKKQKNKTKQNKKHQ